MQDLVKRYTVPAVVTVSRKTGKVTGIEYALTDRENFAAFCRWLLELNGMDEMAWRIPKPKPKQKKRQIST